MAPKIKDTTVPNEWIVRWDDYGNVCESLISYLRHVEIDGEVLKHEVTAQKKLDEKDLPNLSIVSDMAENAMVAVNKLTAERDTLRKDMDAVTAERDAVASERDNVIVLQAQRAREELTGQVADLTGKLQAAGAAYQELVDRANADNQSASAQIAELTGVVNERGEVLTQMSAELSEAVEARDSALSEVAALTEQVSELSAVKSELGQITAERAEFAERSAQLEHRLTGLKTALDAANAAIKKLDPEALIFFEPTDY